MKNHIIKSKENIHLFIEHLIKANPINVPANIESDFILSVLPCYIMFLRSTEKDKSIDATDMDIFLKKMFDDMSAINDFKPHIKELLAVPYIKARLDEKYGVNNVSDVKMTMISDLVSCNSVKEIITYADKMV